MFWSHISQRDRWPESFWGQLPCLDLVPGYRYHSRGQSVLSPVVETTPTLLRSRMGNHPASAPRFAKVRADDKNWGSAPDSRRFCEKPTSLIRIRVEQSNSSRHGWFDRPSFRVPHEAWIAAPPCGDRPWPLPLEQTNEERQRSIRLKGQIIRLTPADPGSMCRPECLVWSLHMRLLLHFRDW